MSQPSLPIEPAPETPPLEERLVAYLDGELPADEIRQVEQLLSSDSQAQRALERLERTWRLLDGLGRSEVGENFTHTTLEVVAVAAEEDARAAQAAAPRRRRRHALAGLAGVLLAGLIGFLAVVALRPDPNRRLLQDLPLLDDVDEYRQIDDLEFLRQLQRERLFVKEADDEG